MAAPVRKGVAALLIVAVLFGTAALLLTYMVGKRLSGGRTVQDVMERFGPEAEATWRERCSRAGVAYPPQELVLAAFKHEMTLEVWGASDGKKPVLLTEYPVLAASGGPGPKLREGDRQIPEGVYRISDLNPNSRYHLSMKIDYPNEEDVRIAESEGRTNLGGDIFIHGAAVSVGCLAIGNDAVQELFVLVAAVGIENVKVLISPNDLRREPPVRPAGVPGWMAGRYRALERELKALGSGKAALR